MGNTNGNHFPLVRLVVALILLSVMNNSQTRIRTEINIPNIQGYLTLKCDFHMHTIFSDGVVWPTVRPEEAWRGGLDAIALTDHIEYLPHKNDIQLNYNRPFELARQVAEDLGIILIKGAEITRKMPPGHFNAIFLEDIDSLHTDNWKAALQAARDQGAFVFWNHPGWIGQRPDGISRWDSVHTELYEQGFFQGIEVINTSEYYPEVHRWCAEKNLTLLANSDVHDPVGMAYDPAYNDYRPLTLVFAKERTAEAIKKALFEHRTVVYLDNILYGAEEFLEPLFYNSLIVEDHEVAIEGKGRGHFQIRNVSDIDFRLILNGEVDDLRVPRQITLYGGKTILFELRGKSRKLSTQRRIKIPYRVENLKIEPERELAIKIQTDVRFIPADK